MLGYGRHMGQCRWMEGHRSRMTRSAGWLLLRPCCVLVEGVAVACGVSTKVLEAMGVDRLVTGCKHHFSPATLGKLRHFPVPSLSKCHPGPVCIRSSQLHVIMNNHSLKKTPGSSIIVFSTHVITRCIAIESVSGNAMGYISRRRHSSASLEKRPMNRAPG
jgi:hypothetical protein